MKQYILSFLCFISSILIFVGGSLLSLLRSLKIIKTISASALILPPSAPGSVGDEAMVMASEAFLKNKGIDQIGIINYNPKLNYPIDVIEAIDLRDYFIYTSWYCFLKKIFLFAYQVSKYEKFYCFGADLMDGYYSDYATLKKVKLVELASIIGVKSAILGFSFNHEPTATAQYVLSNLPSNVRLCARDPVSQKRLANYLNRPIQLVADLAFLLTPSESSAQIDQTFKWIGEQHTNGRIVIGINPNNLLLNDLAAQKPEDLIAAYINKLTELFLSYKKLSFILVPHDFRNLKGKYSDNCLSKKIIEGLPTELQPYCNKLSPPCNAAEIKAIVGNLDVVLSGRMHLAIACLGQGTPVGCITYQGKFEGLFQHFELEGMTISPTEMLEYESTKLIDLVTNIIDNKDAIRQQIQAKLPQVQQLAGSNFVI